MRATQILMAIAGLFALAAGSIAAEINANNPAPAASAIPPAPRQASPLEVLILANANEAQSLELANYYAEKRGIPPKNIISLHMSSEETISRLLFDMEIRGPLVEWLRANSWVSHNAPQTGKEAGIGTHRIGWLVICQGVPLRIAEDPALNTAEATAGFAKILGSPDGKGANINALLKKNFASVDSELAALPAPQNPLTGFVPNPLYRKISPELLDMAGIIRTARLGGSSYEAARKLVDSALEGERKGLHGRVYIDKGGPYPQAEQWLDKLAAMFRATNWDLDLDEDKATFPAHARFDAPALYFGWYTHYVNGAFLEPGMSLPPGAIAMHLHSFSASSLKDSRLWSSALVERGAAGTVGNVYEPTLALTHDFSIIGQALLSGWSFGDAAWCAMPALSWQGIVIGDPLYRPFTRPGTPVPVPSSTQDGNTYEEIRAIIALEKAGRAEDALRLARHLHERRPGYAISLKLAQMQLAAGDKTGAELSLDWMAKAENMDCGQRSVALEAARLLAGGDSDKSAELALEILRNLKKSGASKAFKQAVSALEGEILGASGQTENGQKANAK